MKLAFCPHCHDMFKITERVRRCQCQKVGGLLHENGYTVSVCGDPVIVGVHNKKFGDAVVKAHNGEFDSVSHTAQSKAQSFISFVIGEPTKDIIHDDALLNELWAESA